MSRKLSLGLRLERRLHHMPLLWQMGLVLPALLLLVGVLAGLGMVVANEAADVLAKGRLDAAEIVAAELNHEVGEVFETLEYAAQQNPSELLASPVAVATPLTGLLHPARDSVIRSFVVSADGRLVGSSPSGWFDVGTDVSNLLYVSEPLRTGHRYASPVGVDEETRQPIVILSVPMFDAEGNTIGVMGVAVDPKVSLLTTLVAGAQQMGDTGHAELVDQQNRLIASSEPGHVLGPAEHPAFYNRFLPTHTHAVGVTDPIGDEDPADRGQRHVMAFVPLDVAPWGIALGGSQSAFTALSDRWLWEAVPFGFLAMAIAIYLIWLARRSVVGPVRALTRISEAIAGGDLSTPVPVLGDGEVRELAERFDEMRLHLQLALDALAQEKSRYEGMIESMAEAVICTDMQRRITAFNHAAEVITGWSAEEVLGRRCCDVLQFADESGAVSKHHCPSIGQTPAIGREELCRRKGDRLIVSISNAPIRGQSGSDRGTLYVLRDVSAEAEVDRLKDQFLSTVSHELRTPLGCIKGYASTLLLPSGNWDADTTERCLREVVNASDELEDLVDNLLDMSKIRAGAFTVQPRAIDLANAVATVLQRSAPRARSHSLRIDLPRLMPAILADRRRLEQVMHNLVDNAVKYSPKGGRITISARRIGDEAHVSVVDEGMGIRVEDVPGLFERFHRGRTPQVQQISGCGLGLAICRGIVESHGGRIWVTSPVVPASHTGPGTAVTFTIPLAAAEARQLVEEPVGQRDERRLSA
ncbi:MAG TPA: ATP-binding protein [Chloroflexota bacterium]|nr:ATP-binding protein [Chloroflexota bacterium]